MHYVIHYCALLFASFSCYACVQVQLAAKTSFFSLFCLGLSRSKDLSYFLKMNIVELTIRLSFKGILVSHSSEVWYVDALNDSRK